MARVVLENVWKTFPGPKKELIEAVKDVSFTAEDRELLVLVGPSGSGKSTLLRLIAGLETISAGSISIDSVVMNQIEPKDRDIAMVFQNFALYPHMTVYENLAFPLKLRKVPKPEMDRRVRDAAEMLGLVPCFDRLPKMISGGECQRVAVGRAIVRRPKVFLFDEPLSNLDAQMRVQMRSEIASLHRRLAATMIYVTHDQVEAMTLGDRVAVLRRGSIQQVAAPMELYHQPANLFVAGFIGSPPMNFFSGQILREKGQWRFRAGEGSPVLDLVLPESLPVPGGFAAGQKAVLGLRPEHLTVLPGRDGKPDPAPMANIVPARVEFIERLGPEAYLHTMVARQRCVCRVAPDTAATPGEAIWLRLDLDEAHWFDLETEKRFP